MEFIPDWRPAQAVPAAPPVPTGSVAGAAPSADVIGAGRMGADQIGTGECAALGMVEAGELVRHTAEVLGRLRHQLYGASGAQLTELLTELGELALLVDAAEVAVVAEAAARGVHREGNWPLPVAGWVAAHSRRYASGAGAGRLARVAQAVVPATATAKAGVLAAGQDGAVVGEAVLSGTAPVGCVDVAVEQMHRLVPDLRPEAVPAVWAGYATVAAGGDMREVRQLRPAMYAKYGHPDMLAKDEATARAHTSLSAPRRDVDGLSEYRWTLDSESVALLEAALDPLCAPQPGPDGEADPRSPGRRRSDALIELIRRAVSSTGPGRPAGQLNLIMRAADLAAETGCATTIGTLEAGRFLSVQAARRIACNSQLTPVLLDEHSNPSVIGRTRRLFTPAQVRALLLRDEHCTFPACTRPAGWADAHHLVHWIDGGTTELDNAALLCSDHHHVVHSRRLAGRVGVGPPQPNDLARGAPPPGVGRLRVEWDLTPGSYDRALAGRSLGHQFEAGGHPPNPGSGPAPPEPP